MPEWFTGCRVWLIVGSALASGCGGGEGTGGASGGPAEPSPEGSGGTGQNTTAQGGSGGSSAGEGGAGLGGASGGGSSGPSERVWRGTIEEPLLPSETVDVLSVTDAMLILHVHRPEQRSRLFILNLLDYSHRWVALDVAPNERYRTYRHGIWSWNSDNSGSATARLFSPNGDLVWSWADGAIAENGDLDNVLILGDTALGVLEPLIPGETPQQLVVWTRDGQSAFTETAPLPGQWVAFTPRGTALSWTEGSLFETSTAGLVRTCAVDWELNGWQSIVLDDVTLITTEAGIVSMGDSCDLDLIVPGGLHSMIDASSGMFAASWAGEVNEQRPIELRAVDGTLLGAVQMPSQASLAENERPFQPMQGSFDSSGRSWVLGAIWGDITNNLSPAWVGLVSISSDGTIQTYEDLRGEPFVETSQVFPVAVAQDGDGVLVATTATNPVLGTATPGKLQITRWNSDLSFDPGRPTTDDPDGSGGSGSNELRACKTPNGRICTLLVSGDVTSFAQECAGDGVPVASCDANHVLGCEGAPGTSAGLSVTVSVYWYAAACGNEIVAGQTCITGSQVGSGCP